MTDRCDKKVYDNGTEVFLTHTIPAKEIEKWVQTIATKSEQQVDWSYFGGRAIILALGDLDRVRQTIKDLRETHDDLYWYAVKQLDCFTDQSIAEQIKGIWQNNGF